MLDLIIQNQQDEFQIPTNENLQDWAAAALVVDGAVQVTLRIVDIKESQGLNKEYRGKDKSTNVLSFPMEMPADFADILEINILGDLVVCAEVVDNEYKEQNKTLDSHWAHMLIHGMLHLQGYDHLNDTEADEMEQLEIEILTRLGFDNPYS